MDLDHTRGAYGKPRGARGFITAVRSWLPHLFQFLLGETFQQGQPLGHRESLRDRVHAYFETLARAMSNSRLFEGYREAPTNLNVVQLVKGGMKSDRHFLGFNMPYGPEILVEVALSLDSGNITRYAHNLL